VLGAMAGGDALEIIVALKDLAAGGFRNVERNRAPHGGERQRDEPRRGARAR
jgi:hypothetical protein